MLGKKILGKIWGQKSEELFLRSKTADWVFWRNFFWYDFLKIFGTAEWRGTRGQKIGVTPPYIFAGLIFVKRGFLTTSFSCNIHFSLSISTDAKNGYSPALGQNEQSTPGRTNTVLTYAARLHMCVVHAACNVPQATNYSSGCQASACSAGYRVVNDVCEGVIALS